MENLDKDIELVSNMKNIELKGKVNEQYIYAKIPEEYLNAIENVLADRKMWKKIAEILSQKLLDTYNDKKIFGIDNIVCTKMENRDEFDICRPDVKCTDCIIEWARKEVESDGNK